MAETERVPSTHELYLESLAESRENEGQVEEQDASVPAPYALPDNDTSAYVGVSPEYRTYSSDLLKPLQAEEGPTVDAEVEAAERDLPLQAPANPVHPSEAKVVAVAGDGENTAVTKDDEEADSEPDSPQLPPAPTAPRTRRGSHADSTNDEN